MLGIVSYSCYHVDLHKEHFYVEVSGIVRPEINMDKAGDKLPDIMIHAANGRLIAAEAVGHREPIITGIYESVQ